MRARPCAQTEPLRCGSRIDTTVRLRTELGSTSPLAVRGYALRVSAGRPFQPAEHTVAGVPAILRVAAVSSSERAWNHRERGIECTPQLGRAERHPAGPAALERSAARVVRGQTPRRGGSFGLGSQRFTASRLGDCCRCRRRRWHFDHALRLAADRCIPGRDASGRLRARAAVCCRRSISAHQRHETSYRCDRHPHECVRRILLMSPWASPCRNRRAARFVPSKAMSANVGPAQASGKPGTTRRNCFESAPHSGSRARARATWRKLGS